MDVNLFGDSRRDGVKESFNDHVISFSIGQGDWMNLPIVKIECKNPESDKNVCNKDEYGCALEQAYKDVGWEIFRAAGEIPLGAVSARMDWSDPEEPWVDLEP